jgi:hypothetical protein
MKIKILLCLLISVNFFSCDSGKSKNKELKPGKGTTTGEMVKTEGLSCDEVWLSVNEERIDRRTFIWGETFYVNFNNMQILQMVLRLHPCR